MLTAMFMSSILSPPTCDLKASVSSAIIFSNFVCQAKALTSSCIAGPTMPDVTSNYAVYNTVNICGKVCIATVSPLHLSRDVTENVYVVIMEMLSLAHLLAASGVRPHFCWCARVSHQGSCRLLPFAFMQGWPAMFTALKLRWIPYVSIPTCSWWQCKYAYANQVQCLPS